MPARDCPWSLVSVHFRAAHSGSSLLHAQKTPKNNDVPVTGRGRAKRFGPERVKRRRREETKSPMRLARLVLSACVAVTAVGRPLAVNAEARHAAMVIDANSGQVLHNQAGDELRYPASLTKMMTLYMAFELIENGRLAYQSRLKVSHEAASAAPSKLDLEPGEDIQLIDAIKALITKSANDVAIVIAEHIGGTEANFARLMTAKARQIGMKDTTFRNASGLPDPGQLTTARDMLTLALRLQDDFPRHYGLFTTRSFAYNGATHRNHNTLLGTYSGIDGIKTGYTRASGFNLVSSVRREGRHVVAAVFGGSSAASRNAHMRSLLTRALAKADTEKTRKPVLLARPRLAPRPEAKIADASAPRPVPVAAGTIGKAPVAQNGPVKPPARIPAAINKPAPQPAVETPKIDSQVAAPAVDTPQSDRPQSDTQASDAAADDTLAEFAANAGSAVAEPAAPLIEIAKVRRVMVAPRPGPPRQFSSSETTDQPAEAAIEALAKAPAPEAWAPAGTTETVLTKSPRSASAGFVPASPAEQIIPPNKRSPFQPAARLATDPAAANGPQVVAGNPAPAAAGLANTPDPADRFTAAPALPAFNPPLVPARLPSTLEQQAQSIGTLAAQPLPVRFAQATKPETTGRDAAWRLNGSSSAGAATSTTAAPSGGFQIQIGAFGSAAEAERQLVTIKSRAATVLSAKSALALPVRKGDRQLFRARFTGFDANTAASACTELRRLAIDCFVMKAE